MESKKIRTVIIQAELWYDCKVLLMLFDGIDKSIGVCNCYQQNCCAHLYATSSFVLSVAHPSEHILFKADSVLK